MTDVTEDHAGNQDTEIELGDGLKAEAVETDGDGDSGSVEGAEAPEAEAEVEEQPKKRTPQDRIRELAAEKRAERSRAEAAEKRLADFERRFASLEQGQNRVTAAPVQDQGPDPKNYEFGAIDQRYIQDLAKHQVREQFRTEMATAREQQEKHAASAIREAQMTEARNRANDIISKGEAEYDDYYAIVVEAAEAGKYPLSESTFNAVAEADNPEALSYWLASNVAEAKKIDRMTPAAAAKYLYAKDRELASKKAPKAGAPPANGVKGSSGRFTVAPDTDDLKAFSKQFFAIKN